MQLRFAPIIALLALLLIAFASARAAAPQRLYLPLILAPTAVGEQAPTAPPPSVTPTIPVSATATLISTATTTSSVTPLLTPSATTTATSTETATFTATATPSAAATTTPSATPTVTPSATPTATATPSATVTVTPSATPTMPPPVMIEGGTVSFWPEYAEHSMNGIYQVCTRYNDGAWRSTIPPEHFQAVGNLTYPNVGEVFLENLETGAWYTARITADVSGRLLYRFTNVPSGDYRLIPYLFYKHQLDPADLPRRYGWIDTGTEVVSELRVTIAPGQNNILELNLQLRLSGDVCALP